MQFLESKNIVRKNLLSSESGFTLMEIIMVIVILGVLGIVGADFISQMFRGFADTNTRLDMYEEGKSALVRMERELHGMLPNAICVTNDQGANCVNGNNPGNEIRFGMIAEDTMRTNSMVGGYTEQPIDFPQTVPGTLTDTNPASTPPVSGVVSIYNTSWATFVGGARLFSITGVTGAEMIFGGQTITNPSPQQRYYVMDRTVSYRYNIGTNTLLRSVTTVGSGGVGNFALSTEYPLARDVSAFDFYYTAPSLSRNGIISVVFTMSKENGLNLVMHKEIHVKNVP